MHYSGYKLEFEAFKKISRLMDVKLFKTAFELIDKYYESDDYEYLPHTDLSEAYPYLDSFCKLLAYMNPNKNSISGNIFEDNEKYLMYKYIYASKGSDEALHKIKVLTGVNIELFYGTEPRRDYELYNKVKITFPENNPINYDDLTEIKSTIIKLLPELIWRTEKVITQSDITVDNVIVIAEFYNNNIFNYKQNDINHIMLNFLDPIDPLT